MDTQISLDELCAIVGQPPRNVEKNMMYPAVYMLSDVLRLKPEITMPMAVKRLRLLRTAMRARTMR